MLILLIDFRKSFEQNRWIQSNCAAYFAKLTPAFEKRNYFQTRSSFSTALRNILLMKTGACCCYKRLFKGPWTLQWYFRVCANYSWESEKKFSSRLLSHFHATPRTQQHRSVDENCLCVLYVYHNFCNSLWCFFLKSDEIGTRRKQCSIKVRALKSSFQGEVEDSLLLPLTLFSGLITFLFFSRRHHSGTLRRFFKRIFN